MGVRGLQVALHGQQHAIDRHVMRNLLDRLIEQALAHGGIDVLAQAQRLTLSRQPVGDQNELIGTRKQGLRLRESVVETGAAGGHDHLQGLHGALELRGVAA